MTHINPVGSDDISFLRLVNTLLRRRASILIPMLVVPFIVGLVSLNSDRTYTASATFMPQSRGGPANLGGLAAQFGVALSPTDASQSASFYAELAKSRTILEGVVDSKYSFGREGDSEGTLTHVFESVGRTPALMREATIERLRAVTDVTVSLKTGVIRLNVTLNDPILAQRITARYLELLSEFNLRTRQSQGAAERQFTSQRVDEVRRDLKRAEDRLQEFLQRNRDYRNSPQLMFQSDRLAREVAMQQEIYTALVQAYERAKIEEVRDTPVITIIEKPQVPLLPDPRRTVRKTILGLLLGSVLGVGLAFGKEYLHNTSAVERMETEEFRRLRSSLLENLRHPLRTLKGNFTRSKASSSSANQQVKEKHGRPTGPGRI